MHHLETAALLCLDQLDLPRRELRLRYQQMGSFASIWSALPVPDKEQRFKDSQRCCQELQLDVLTPSMAEYPEGLQEISSAPFFLMLRGQRSVLRRGPMLAIVGTRKMSAYGRQVLQKLIPPLARAGVTIVSGLAYGVDSLAHEIALEHGGHCVAVLGSGVDVIYPQRHRPLAERILASGGALLSEQPLGMKPLPQFFPARNRIISGLCQAVLVVEAQERSGSLITADFALEQNRDVYAVPGSILTANQRGTNALIAQGAIPVLSANQLLQELGLEISSSSEQSSRPDLRGADEQRVFAELEEARSLDELSQACDLTTARLAMILSRLEMRGLVERLANHRYSRKGFFS